MSLQIGLNTCTNSEYHADKEYLSSSNYKTLLKDPELFYKEKILGLRESKSSPSMEEGSLTHSLILEPQLVKDEYAFYQGLRKVGPEFNAFAAANSHKTVMSRPQQIRCELYRDTYLQNSTAVKLISGGYPELTICQMLNDIPTKVRCDYINIEAGYIADVKTSAYPIDVENFRTTVDRWGYGLSASLYTRVAELYYGKPFSFYFIAIYKGKPTECRVFKASEATMRRGLQDIAKAAEIYKTCKATGIWKLDQQPAYISEEVLEV